MKRKKPGNGKNKDLNKENESVADIKKKIRQEKEALLKLIKNIRKDQ
jgi:hypothetical protein